MNHCLVMYEILIIISDYSNEMLRNRRVVLQINSYINNLKNEFKQQICGILNLFKFLEPDENFEENLDSIIKQWLETRKHTFIVPTFETPQTDGLESSDV